MLFERQEDYRTSLRDAINDATHAAAAALERCALAPVSRHTFTPASPIKDAWHRDLKSITVISGDAKARLEGLLSRVAECRRECDTHGFNPLVYVAPYNEREIAQRQALTEALQYFEDQLSRLIRLAKRWQES